MYFLPTPIISGDWIDCFVNKYPLKTRDIVISFAKLFLVMSNLVYNVFMFIIVLNLDH